MNSPSTLPQALLFDSTEISRIKHTLERDEFSAFWSASRDVDLADDLKFLTEEIKLNEPVKDLGRASNILMRCAYVHLLSGDAKQLPVARLALDRILGFKRWDWILEDGTQSVGVMRNGMTATAVVLALDWLGDHIDADQREAVDKFVGEISGPAAQRAVFGMTHHDQVKGWTMDPEMTGYHPVDVSKWPVILDRINLRIIATSGLASSAAYLKGRHPDAAQWAEEAQASLRLFASREQPDATFPEGIGYWSFTYSYYILCLELLRRSYGQDDRGVLDFPAMTRYVLGSTITTHDDRTDFVNISDANQSAGAEPLAWIGRQFRDATSNYLISLPNTVRQETPTTFWGAIWFDETVPARRAADTALDRIISPGIITSRSGWETGDSLLCLRTGEPENHEHADRNSLLFFYNGERLINDPLKASYNPPESRWQLRLPPAHSAVLIDGQGHIYHNGEEGTNASTARAILQDYRTGRNWMIAVSDAADAYQRANLPAQQVQRTVIFLKPEILIVLDRVALSEPRPVQVRFQAYNDDGKGQVVTCEHGFKVSRPHATLHASVGTLHTRTIETSKLPIKNEEEKFPYVEISSPAFTHHEILTVSTAAPPDGKHGELTCEHAESGWHIHGTHGGRKIDLQINTASAIPQVIL